MGKSKKKTLRKANTSSSSAIVKCLNNSKVIKKSVHQSKSQLQSLSVEISRLIPARLPTVAFRQYLNLTKKSSHSTLNEGIKKLDTFTLVKTPPRESTTKTTKSNEFSPVPLEKPGLSPVDLIINCDDYFCSKLYPSPYSPTEKKPFESCTPESPISLEDSPQDDQFCPDLCNNFGKDVETILTTLTYDEKDSMPSNLPCHHNFSSHKPMSAKDQLLRSVTVPLLPVDSRVKTVFLKDIAENHHETDAPDSTPTDKSLNMEQSSVDECDIRTDTSNSQVKNVETSTDVSSELQTANTSVGTSDKVDIPQYHLKTVTLVSTPTDKSLNMEQSSVDEGDIRTDTSNSQLNNLETSKEDVSSELQTANTTMGTPDKVNIPQYHLKTNTPDSTANDKSLNMEQSSVDEGDIRTDTSNSQLNNLETSTDVSSELQTANMTVGTPDKVNIPQYHLKMDTPDSTANDKSLNMEQSSVDEGDIRTDTSNSQVRNVSSEVQTHTTLGTPDQLNCTTPPVHNKWLKSVMLQKSPMIKKQPYLFTKKAIDLTVDECIHKTTEIDTIYVEVHNKGNRLLLSHQSSTDCEMEEKSHQLSKNVGSANTVPSSEDEGLNDINEVVPLVCESDPKSEGKTDSGKWISAVEIEKWPLTKSCDKSYSVEKLSIGKQVLPLSLAGNDNYNTLLQSKSPEKENDKLCVPTVIESKCASDANSYSPSVYKRKLRRWSSSQDEEDNHDGKVATPLRKKLKMSSSKDTSNCNKDVHQSANNLMSMASGSLESTMKRKLTFSPVKEATNNDSQQTQPDIYTERCQSLLELSVVCELLPLVNKKESLVKPSFPEKSNADDGQPALKLITVNSNEVTSQCEDEEGMDQGYAIEDDTPREPPNASEDISGDKETFNHILDDQCKQDITEDEEGMDQGYVIEDDTPREPPNVRKDVSGDKETFNHILDDHCKQDITEDEKVMDQGYVIEDDTPKEPPNVRKDVSGDKETFNHILDDQCKQDITEEEDIVTSRPSKNDCDWLRCDRSIDSVPDEDELEAELCASTEKRPFTSMSALHDHSYSCKPMHVQCSPTIFASRVQDSTTIDVLKGTVNLFPCSPKTPTKTKQKNLFTFESNKRKRKASNGTLERVYNLPVPLKELVVKCERLIPDNMNILSDDTLLKPIKQKCKPKSKTKKIYRKKDKKGSTKQKSLKDTEKARKRKKKKTTRIPMHYTTYKPNQIRTIKHMDMRYRVAFSLWPEKYSGALNKINQRLMNQNAFWKAL